MNPYFDEPTDEALTASDAASSMYVLAEELKNLRAEKDAAEEHLKDINAKISVTELHLAEMMASSETQNFTRAGTMFSLTTKTRASAVAGRKDELFSALKEQGHRALVVETVNANTLSSFVKEQIAGNDDALPTWLDGLVNVFEQVGVSVRKSTKKK